MRIDPDHNGDHDSTLDSEPESPLTPRSDLFEPQGHYEWTFRDHGRKKIIPPPEVTRKFSEQRKSPEFLKCRIPRMTEDVARNVLRRFVSSKCCYGNRAAEELVIQELKQQMFYRYRLQTFTETRLSKSTFEPYTNKKSTFGYLATFKKATAPSPFTFWIGKVRRRQRGRRNVEGRIVEDVCTSSDTLVDGPQNGVSPHPWDIKVQGPQMFQEDTKNCRVPHSSLVKECHKCHGRGRYKCSGCHGAGRMRCITYSGAKHKAKHQKHQKRCQMCSGTGRKRFQPYKISFNYRESCSNSPGLCKCSMCSGRGNKTCATCQGEKKLLHFNQLMITWRNNVYEFISEDSELNFPQELLSKVTGENVFKDQNTQVYPLVDFPYPEISLASERAIGEHNAAFASTSRILQQQQTIELIPVTEVHCQYAGKQYLYYVYGIENKVHALDYPERYCCGCIII